MTLKRYKDWRLLSKVMTIPLVSFLIILVAVEFFVVPFVEHKLLEDKENATRQTVEIAYGILEEAARLAQSGRDTQEEAKARAIAAIKSLRYSGNEYFWINDLTPKMIMHPTKPELDGKDLTDNKDPNGKHLFVEFVKICKEKGGGFVDYMWPKPGEQNPVPKISYVKLFAPWGWIVGSGVYVDDVVTEVNHLKWWIHGASFLFSLLLLLLAISVGLGIIRPLKAVISQLKEMATGDADLTQRIEITCHDESGELAESFNSFLQNLQKVINKVRDSATSVAESAHGLRKQSEEMAQGMQEVALDAGTVTSAGEQMALTATTIASSCMTAADASETTSSFARDGATVVQQTIEVMNQISTQVMASSTTVGSLVEKSNQIGAIIGTIEDIADQTNLLALNAAIEAARAGEQGRGFAVVADEVRALAERTTKATKEIATMIKAIQQETQGAVNIMNQAVSRVQEGTGEAAKSGEALQQILNQVEQVTSQINQIATTAEEQTATTSEISSNIGRITQQAVEKCGHASDMASGADSLNSLAEELISSVNRFQTIIKWNNWMSVKVNQFDDEHKKLIQMIGQLNEAMKNGEGDKVISDVLASLAAYCVNHFANEERLMQQYNYPEYAEHKKAHEAFVQKVGEAINAFENQTITPASIMNILSDWLMNHILKVDKRYADFFSKKKV